MRSGSRTAALAAALAMVLSAASAAAETVVLSPVKDNTIYTDSFDLSNGSGDWLFAGKTAGGGIRRALLAFDVAGSVPDGATITAVTLTLTVDRVASVTARQLSLHRLTSDWGEGASDALGQEGAGATAQAGDATWSNAFHPDTPWDTAGGDYFVDASAQKEVTGTGAYDFAGPGLVNDVQAMVDVGADFGWIVLGEEVLSSTAKRFQSRENPDVAGRPTLTVDFEPGVPAESVGSGRFKAGYQE